MTGTSGLARKQAKSCCRRGGGEVQFGGGGANRPSFAGSGPTKDWMIRSGLQTGSVKIQDQGGLTEIGGDMSVAQDLKLGGHLYLTSGSTTQTLESRLEDMESKLLEMQRMYEELGASL